MDGALMEDWVLGRSFDGGLGAWTELEWWVGQGIVDKELAKKVEERGSNPLCTPNAGTRKRYAHTKCTRSHTHTHTHALTHTVVTDKHVPSQTDT